MLCSQVRQKRQANPQINDRWKPSHKTIHIGERPHVSRGQHLDLIAGEFNRLREFAQKAGHHVRTPHMFCFGGYTSLRMEQAKTRTPKPPIIVCTEAKECRTPHATN
jgi:hypothetical protein